MRLRRKTGRSLAKRVKDTLFWEMNFFLLDNSQEEGKND